MVFLNGQQVTASYGRGSIGRSVDVELAGGCMQLMIPDHADAPASLRFTFSLERLEPAAALRLLRIHEHIVASGAFQVRARAGVIGGGDLHAKPEAARQEAAELRRYLDDLEVVQRHCEQYFPVPAELAPAERIALRMARLLVDGHCVISRSCPKHASRSTVRTPPSCEPCSAASHTPCEASAANSPSRSPGGAWTWAPCSSSTPASPPRKKTPSRPSPPSMPDAATARSSPCDPPTKSTSGSNCNPLPPGTNPSPHRSHCARPPRTPLTAQGCAPGGGKRAVCGRAGR
ncbi:hypothetical protein [Streptomyces sp. NPDC019507]|uniref:hypothetical protein n=1 Tax=Streptomyces sp. NPDC019507 TaxID=3154689 RepID=UPI0033ED7BB9